MKKIKDRIYADRVVTGLRAHFASEDIPDCAISNAIVRAMLKARKDRDMGGTSKSLIGRKVKVGNAIRTIVGTYSDIKVQIGGVVLDAPVGNLKSWNLDELVFVEE